MRARFALIVAVVAGLSLFAGVSSAAAEKVYDYVYSGEYIDGSGSEEGPFPTELLGVGYDGGAGKLVTAANASTYSYLSRFDTDGTPSPFNPPTIGDTIQIPGKFPGGAVQLAINNTGGPADGNIYLEAMYQFGGGGQFLAYERDGTPIEGLEFETNRSCGVAIDPEGYVWVGGNSGFDSHVEIRKYTASGKFTGTIIDKPDLREECDPVIDGEGNFYIYVVDGNSKKVLKISPTGETLYQLNTDEWVNGLAIDPSNNDVFVSEGLGYEGTTDPIRISQFNSEGTKLNTFGLPEPSSSYPGLQGSAQLTVDPETHDVWVANRRSYSGVAHLEKFSRTPATITVPTARTEPPEITSTTTARFHATINADGIPTVDCHFDWGPTPAVANEVPCEQGNVFTGSEDHAVTAEVAGLTKGQTYYVALSSKNGNERISSGGTKKFIAQGKPILSREYVNHVNTDGVQINVHLDPNGGPTSYRFEYGLSANYEHQSALTPLTEEIEVGYLQFKTVPNLLKPKDLSYVITGLSPGVTYHYRIVATDEAGTTTSEDREFTTYVPDPGTDPCANAQVRKQTESGLLLDCRAYELVSAPDAGGYDVESDLVPNQTPFSGYPAADGSLLYGLHYGSVPGIAGSPTNHGLDPYLATRGANGWTTKYVGLPADGMATSTSFGSPLLEADPDLNEFAFGGSGICEPCYEDGSTNIPLRLSNGELVKGMAGSRKPAANRTGFVGKAFSADGKHFVFESNARFESAAINGEDTVYDRDFAEGTTQVVSTLPSGSPMSESEGEPGELDISADGSHILVGQKLSTDADGNSYWHLYMHVGASAKSVDLTPATTSGVLFDGMTSDGSKVFFTTTDKLLSADEDESADIYEAELKSNGSVVTQLVSVGQGGPSNSDSCEPPGAPNTWNAVEGDGKCNAVAFAGGAGLASGDGTFYFLSPELLDGPTNGVVNQPNLYVSRPGSAPRFVATMDSSLAKSPPAPERPLVKAKFGGTLSGPEALTVDQSNGDVYAIEYGNRALARFTSAGAPKNFSAIGGNQIEHLSIGEESSSQVAIDNSSSPFGGDIYVTDGSGIDLYGPDGSSLGRLDGSGTDQGSFSNPCGVAVDQADGTVYVADRNGHIWRYEPTSGVTPASDSDYAVTGITTQSLSPCAIAADSAGKIYAAEQPSGSVKEFHSTEFETKAPAASGSLIDGTGQALAVDPTTNDLYVDEGSQVVLFNSVGERQATFTSGISGSRGVAVNDVTHHVFISKTSGSISEFGYAVPPVEPIDNPAIKHAVADNEVHSYGDFQVSPNGKYAIFASSLPLLHGIVNFGNSLVYRYDAEGDGTLDCASCASTGAASVTGSSLPAYGSGLTEDGRVFFTSAEPLVLRDANEKKDAYEWSNGVLQLISTGQSPEDSSFLSVTADGTDAFFFTRQTLAHEDENGSTIKVYDARTGGGFPYDPPPFPCAASDECHGPGTEQPPAPTVNTVTGAGSATATATEETKKPTKKPQHHKPKKHKKQQHRKHKKSHGKAKRHGTRGHR